MNEWVLAVERLPKAETTVNVIIGGKIETAFIRNKVNGWSWFDEYGDIEERYGMPVEAWQPLDI